MKEEKKFFDKLAEDLIAPLEFEQSQSSKEVKFSKLKIFYFLC